MQSLLGHSRSDISSWWDTFSRPWCDGRFKSGVSCHCIYLWSQGAVLPGFNPFRRGWVYHPVPEAPLLEDCRWGPRHFWKCRARVSPSPAPGPTLKKALCHTRPVGGTEDKHHPLPTHMLTSLSMDFYCYRRIETIEMTLSWFKHMKWLFLIFSRLHCRYLAWAVVFAWSTRLST